LIELSENSINKQALQWIATEEERDEK